jgi:hypothetical protein
MMYGGLEAKFQAFLVSALDCGDGRLHAPTALRTIKKPQVPFYKWLGGTNVSLDEEANRTISDPARNRTLAVQSIASHFIRGMLILYILQNMFSITAEIMWMKNICLVHLVQDSIITTCLYYH